MQRALPSLVGALFVSSCLPTETRLEPAPGARVIAPDTAIEQVAGVTVRARVDAWPGHQGVLRHVTPVRVMIRNDSNRPVRIQYRRFALVGPSGERFAALPPFRIEGSVAVAARPVTYGYPYAGYTGFYVDPLYADVWPGFSPYETGLYDYDPFYYDTYYSYWRRPLPTPEMLARALPEGVLEPGGRISGFLYFEKLDEQLPWVRLTAQLVDARSGRRFATARIPFLVEEG